MTAKTERIPFEFSRGCSMPGGTTYRANEIAGFPEATIRRLEAQKFGQRHEVKRGPGRPRGKQETEHTHITK